MPAETRGPEEGGNERRLGRIGCCFGAGSKQIWREKKSE